MKKNFILITIVFLCGQLAAQTAETVSVGANYVNEVYYTLETQDEVSVVRDNWDLAFAGNEFGVQFSTIRINGGMGAELYFYEDGVAWDNVDTLNFDWMGNQRINSSQDWRIGACENAEQATEFDLGWGTYNPITHIVTGDRIFIIKLADGSYRKLIIEIFQGGVYTFKYADLDGANEVSNTLNRADYMGKNFAYYSIQNNVALDREPMSENWDMVFTKYIADVGGGFLYGVTGVFANHGVQVAQANGVADVNTESYIGQDFTNDIGTIGYDWKEFNMNTFVYDITESLVYFVQTPNLDVYRVIFTGFGGSATGEYMFTQELVGNTVSINENNAVSNILSVYPNPAADQLNLTFVGNDTKTQITLTDLTGKQVYSNQVGSANGLNQEFIDVSGLSRGTYFLSVVSGQKIATQKVILD